MNEEEALVTPDDYSDDQFERRLAEGREALRRSEEARSRSEEARKPLRDSLVALPPDPELEELRRRGRERSERFDKDMEETRKQSREFQDKLHKVSMVALSRIETEAKFPTSIKSAQGPPTKKPRGFKGLPNKLIPELIANANLTDKQQDAAMMVWEHNIKRSEAARRLGIDRKSLDERLAGAKKRIDGAQKKIEADRKRAVVKPGALED